MTNTIERINALTKNARNTWFAMLAAIAFVGVTLLGVQTIDFYGVARTTQLPVIGVSVPTDLFFYAAPVLTVAVYAYFHLYLIRLWDALSEAEAMVGDKSQGTLLGEATSPWLITDSALYLRNLLRSEVCTRPRSLEFPSAFWNILLAWLAGPAVLFYLWQKSLPARDVVMSGLAAAMVIFALVFGLGSAFMLVRRMRCAPVDTKFDRDEIALWTLLLMVPVVLLFGAATWQFTSPKGSNLAAINLNSAKIVERPDGWVPYALAKADFYVKWCEREGEPCKVAELPPDRNHDFEAEWKERRAIALADLVRPKWMQIGAAKPNLSGADLSFAFLTGANLFGAQMEGAHFFNAQLEGAELGFAQMNNANLALAQLQGAVLREANLKSANLVQAQMEGADLHKAQMSEADLSWAQLDGADLSEAQMPDANLSRVKLGLANLFEAQMQRVNLSDAKLEGADLRSALMPGAVLHRAHIEWANFAGANLVGADLSEAQMPGAVLVDPKLEEVDFRWAKMQATLLIRAQMQGTNLSRAMLEEANFSNSFLAGTVKRKNTLHYSNLSASLNAGGALRFVDLRDILFDQATDFRNAFLDGSVQMTDAFRDQMGTPCQWAGEPEPLSDKVFFGRWRGWIEHTTNPNPPLLGWSIMAPEGFKDVTPIAPPDGCEWKTDPLP